MSQNKSKAERTQSLTIIDSNVNRVKAIQIGKGRNNTPPKFECNPYSIRRRSCIKQENEVQELGISDQERDNYNSFMNIEREDSDISDRGRESSQSSHTVVEEVVEKVADEVVKGVDGEEIYEIPLTRSRSVSKKPSSAISEPESREVSGEIQIGRNTSSTCSTISVKRRKSSAVASDASRTKRSKVKSSQQKSRRRSLPSLSQYESLFPVCDNHHNTKKKSKHRHNRGRLCSNDIVLTEKCLGEGQIGKVYIGYYHGLPVACKTKRRQVDLENYERQVLRELTFAAKFSVCKYMNRYIGWFKCPNEITNEDGISEQSICIVQKYIENGDSRKYLYHRDDSFKPFEVLNATICLFTALRDAHNLNIGIVDLKLENFLIDSAGTGWITDFGSCIEFHDAEVVSLDDNEVTWTVHVAAPEMISRHEFRKASDVFMATLIAAELMTGDLTDEAFKENVLRREPEGKVNLSCDGLNKSFEAFFTILEAGLKNDPEERPTAENILEKLLIIRDTMSVVV